MRAQLQPTLTLGTLIFLAIAVGCGILESTSRRSRFKTQGAEQLPNEALTKADKVDPQP